MKIIVIWAAHIVWYQPLHIYFLLPISLHIVCAAKSTTIPWEHIFLELKRIHQALSTFCMIHTDKLKTSSLQPEKQPCYTESPMKFEHRQSWNPNLKGKQILNHKLDDLSGQIFLTWSVPGIWRKISLTKKHCLREFRRRFDRENLPKLAKLWGKTV